MGVSFLTFGGYRFLRLEVSNNYVWGLVFLRLGVMSNSYVWGLVITTFGGVSFRTFGVSNSYISE